MEQENSPQLEQKKKRIVSESFVGTIIASVLVIALLAGAGFYFVNERLAQQKNAQAAAALQAEQIANFATTTVIIQATTTATSVPQTN